MGPCGCVNAAFFHSHVCGVCGDSKMCGLPKRVKWEREKNNSQGGSGRGGQAGPCVPSYDLDFILHMTENTEAK